MFRPRHRLRGAGCDAWAGHEVPACLAGLLQSSQALQAARQVILARDMSSLSLSRSRRPSVAALGLKRVIISLVEVASLKYRVGARPKSVGGQKPGLGSKGLWPGQLFQLQHRSS